MRRRNKESEEEPTRKKIGELSRSDRTALPLGMIQKNQRLLCWGFCCLLSGAALCNIYLPRNALLSCDDLSAGTTPDPGTESSILRGGVALSSREAKNEEDGGDIDYTKNVTETSAQTISSALLSTSPVAAAELQKEIEKLRSELKEAKTKSNEEHSEESDTISSNDLNNDETNPPNGKNSIDEVENICSLPLASLSRASSFPLTLETASAHKIWHQFIPKIFNLSHHHDDPDFIWHDFTQMLMDFVTPRMRDSVKHLPVLHWDKVGHIMELAFQRYKHIQKIIKTGSSDMNPPPRKVRVLVLGGSVTDGVNCAAYPEKLDGPSYRYKPCSWSQRLSRTLDEMFGSVHRDGGVFSIQLVAIGGTNSKVGLDLVKYNILNDENLPYDIIINAYATNDMHIISVNEAKEKNTTLAESLFDVSQDFIRTVLDDYKRCKGRKLPLLLYFNDYMGNEQKGILDIDSYSTAMNTLASYYGIGQISYADMVKHTVLGDTDETWFSPNGWPDRQIHPGRGFHIITSWLFIYYFLEMMTTYCDMKSTNTLPLGHHPDDVHSFVGGAGNSTNIVKSNWTSGYAHIESLPPLLKNSTMPNLPRLPRAIPLGLPPILNAKLTLENVSEEWRTSEMKAITAENTACPDGDKAISPCAFSFITGLTTTKFKKQLSRVLNSRMTHNDGWEVVWDHNKLGFSAMKANATFTIEMDSGQRPVKVLKLLSMKSYGEKWEGSEVAMRASVISASGVNHTASLRASGIHNKSTTETYTHELKLEGDQVAMPNNRLRVQFDLIGGTTFKITGMLFCEN